MSHPGEEVCSQTINGVIGQLDGFLIMFELEQGHSRAKCFFLVDLQPKLVTSGFHKCSSKLFAVPATRASNVAS